jgi:hypothetical protein
MKLKDYVDNSIYHYPSLYRSTNYKDSRLRVLDHLFLTNGNGMEWHPDGFLAECINGKYKTIKPVKLPKNFFTIDLRYIKVKKIEELPKLKKILKSTFHYIKENEYDGDHAYVEFQANNKIIETIQNVFPNSYFLKADCSSGGWEIEPHEPYPLCQYAALVEMVNKRTNSLHIENFDLFKIQPDWIQGAIEIAKYAIGYYNNPKRYKSHVYHYSNAIDDISKRYKEDPKKFVEERKTEGMTDKHTPEQWAKISWKKFRKEQIAYCEKLLEIYGR